MIFFSATPQSFQDGLELRAGYILVAEGGYFQVGSRTKPMELLGNRDISGTYHSSRVVVLGLAASLLLVVSKARSP